MNGVFDFCFGEPEKWTPSFVFGNKLDTGRCTPFHGPSPIAAEEIAFRRTARGCELELPLGEDEAIFGFGLQLKSLNQVSKKKALRVNSDPIADTGDSHAPAPFYVSTGGYAVLIDTARYATFYVGSHIRNVQQGSDAAMGTPGDTTESLYSARESSGRRQVLVEIPSAAGVRVLIFAGPTMKEAVERYNMYSGGGYMPPMWGLGVWYRSYTTADQNQVTAIADEIRRDHIPCDVFGLEPGWQSARYPCSFSFDRGAFAQPDRLMEHMTDQHYHVNLWEHVFVHPQSKIHKPLQEFSGDYPVWGGLVPDLLLPQARQIFAQHHRRELVDIGISGFKLDECDNSDFNISPWSFPETSSFPSGVDGEQMHSLLGGLYQQTIMDAFEGMDQRTLCSVRSSGAFQSDMPFVLYSDLYDHKDFIRGLVNAGFSGLSWTPEVRQCDTLEDFYRRVQSAMFSPMALINGWMIPNPPWKQYDIEKNKQGIFPENLDEIIEDVREMFGLRTRFVPYLYTAYHIYKTKGTPPFRALVMDYPEDAETWKCDQQYMMGDSVMVAPLVAGTTSRMVYFPAGEWYDFYTGEHLSGGEWRTVSADQKTIPLFIKGGTLLPVAEPVEYFEKNMPLTIHLVRYGEGTVSCRLFEDDGETNAYQRGEYNIVTAVWKDGELAPEICRQGSFPLSRYQFVY